ARIAPVPAARNGPTEPVYRLGVPLWCASRHHIFFAASRRHRTAHPAHALGGSRMDDSPGLRRTLGFPDLVLITVGTTIGSGIFLVPGIVLRETGARSGVALAVWAVAGVLSLLGALTYAELGGMFPGAGGLYAYIRDAFGPLPAFLFGWTSFVVIGSGSIATLAVAFGGYATQIVPMGAWGARLVALLLIAFTAAVNILGTRKGATLQNWTTAAKVLGLVGLSVALLIHGDHGAGQG